MQDTIGELWIQTHITTSFQYDILCILTLLTWKVQVVYGCCTYQMTPLVFEISIFCIKAGCKIQLVSYASKHALQCLLINHLCIHTLLSWKLEVIHGYSAYQMTGLPSETVLLLFRVEWEIWLESYSPRHVSVVFWYNIVYVYCKLVHTLLFSAHATKHDNKTHLPYDCKLHTKWLRTTYQAFTVNNGLFCKSKVL